MPFQFHAKSLFPAVAPKAVDPACESTFATSANVGMYVQLSDIQVERNVPIAEVDRDRDILFTKIVHAIKRGAMTLVFSPADKNMVSIPQRYEARYTECVFYWCAKLNAKFPEVLEASARAGQDVSPEVIARTIAKIRFEDESCQTNWFFPQLV